MATRGINLHPHPETFHPSSIPKTTFDVIIIGAGPIAVFAKNRLANAGLDVAIVQYEIYGGECHFFGCLPSKALLRPIEAYEAAKAISGANEAIGSSKIDVDAIFARRDKLVDLWDDSKYLGADNGSSTATVIRGFARIAGNKKVTVQPYGEEKRFALDAKIAVIVATGSSQMTPSIPGIETLQEGKELWINRDAVSSNKVPQHLVILGAGAVGSEMASFYSAVGAKVTLISNSAEILPKVEPEAGKIVRQKLEKQGVVFKLGTHANQITKLGPNSIKVELSNGEIVSGSVLLNATGRKPRTFDMGLDTIGLPGEGAAIETNTSFVSTSKPWLYAIGDVNGIAPTTHMGIYQSRIASNAILAALKSQNHPNLTVAPHFTVTKAAQQNNTFPQVIYTEPNIGSIGYTLASAQAAGLKVRAADSSFAFPGGMLYGDDQPGWARFVIEEGTEKLVGATYVAVEGAEFVNAAQVAIQAGLTLEEMVHVVPPFPSRGEIWTYLLNAAGY